MRSLSGSTSGLMPIPESPSSSSAQSSSDLSFGSSQTLETSNFDNQASLQNPVRSTFYIIVLTLIVGALQLAWSTEFSEATPFLLSLGLSKHVLALVWLAGPLSGSIGQPIVGMLSDRCNLSWGRRRIFILVGSFATLLSLLCLAHSTGIISLFIRTKDTEKINFYTIPFACLGVYVLDFSIAVIQASARALIVDVVPTSQQQISNAWAARMIGIFNIVGFCFGSINLPDLFPLFGDNQFKVLSILVTIMMGSMTIFSCFYIKERNPKKDVAIRYQRQQSEKRLREMGIDEEQCQRFWVQVKIFFAQIVHSFKRLPPQVKTVCYTEFFAWVGYFPMMFYTSSYVGELYLYENGYASPDKLPPNLKQKLTDESTRRGTIALLVNSIITLTVDIAAPALVDKATRTGRWHHWCSLRMCWIVSHVVFILCMAGTFMVNSSIKAIVLFAFLGFPWGCAVWIPFALISEEIGRIKDIRAVQISYTAPKSTREVPGFSSSEASGQLLEDTSSRMMLQSMKDCSLPALTDANKLYLAPSLCDFYGSLVHDSGIILAIHNVFVSAPQMVSSVVSSILFKIFQSGDGFDNSLAWVFRFGGIVAVGALILSLSIKTSEQQYAEDQQRAVQP